MSSDPLTTLPAQFINWGMIDGRKVPVHPQTGRTINHLEPGNWQTLDVARQSEFPVAFVLTEHDPYFFVDLDKCYVDGEWTAEASAIYQSFTGCMGEVSQSGAGLHILGKCDPKQLTDRKRKFGGVELYTFGRFIAFGDTGWNWIGTADIDRDWTQTLLKWTPQRDYDPSAPLPTERDPAWSGPEDDVELLRIALRSTGGALGAFGAKATFKDLWNADQAVLTQFYPARGERSDGLPYDASDARIAMLNHLAFWTGKDMARMDRLFRQSGLMNKKWDERGELRVSELSNSIRSTDNVYQTRKAPAVQNIDATSDKNLTYNEQIEYFTDCCYIVIPNRVLIPDGTILKPESFRNMYAGKRFQIDAANDRGGWTDDAFKAFTHNREVTFPRAANTMWNPNHKFGTIIGNRVNTYVPAVVETEPGNVEPFLGLLRKQLPHPVDMDIVLNYMASAVQNPGVKFRWAPVMQGVEGNGKGFLGECLSYAVGEDFVQKPNAQNLTEKFNSSLVEKKLLVIVDEIHMGDSRDVMDTLKPLITDNKNEIRPMGDEKRMAENFANWFFNTNFKDAIRKTANDRRYAVFFTAHQTYEDLARDGMVGDYFPDLWKWGREGGFKRVAHFLRTFKLNPDLDPADRCHRAPITSTTNEAISSAMGRVEAEITDAIESEEIGFRGGWVSSVKLIDLLDHRGIRIGRGRLNTIMSSLGYFPCPALTRGRSSRPLSMEQGKRPILYSVRGKEFSDDATSDYCTSQNYGDIPPPV